ncbi:MAG: M23 family metallopeptidase [Ardenticatenaceae bacterium]|nr:M23 family metallopeptidase [Ardenticatenaceae bacterium]
MERRTQKWPHAAAIAVVLLSTSLLAGRVPVMAQGLRPFILPFKEPPGPDTWLFGQPYGNTTGAYRQRYRTYSAGQGVHFGVDFTAPCGTEVVAIGDGVVFAVDNLNFGAAPHNLMIDHPDRGYASFYGHLLARPHLQPGQRVTAGQVVALSGDPDETCNTRAHLHLEIRDLRHVRKYNPVTLIEADWNTLALGGGFTRTFQRDLDNPRKWQHLDDQPEVIIGGPLLNNYASTWPPDPRRR